MTKTQAVPFKKMAKLLLIKLVEHFPKEVKERYRACSVQKRGIFARKHYNDNDLF